ncbi:PEPxxWA-CTERM sorting domain-containing protein [Phenylobacterium sp.]|uniref:PEPxxWA-CTERM sorting domain-containing protein n=1 Tax=Phenylobacterium sp. TaxID=1871053 RepID=UPI0025FFAD4C|nr:PEPxxWA-CTERM sorting domain-containing protein [Phenylobacterium sp.]
MLAGAVIACALIATSAHAAAQLDQADIPEAGPIPTASAGYAISDGFAYGQTFTAGLTGRLTRVDLAIFGTQYDVTGEGFSISLEQTPGVTLYSSHFNFTDVADPYLNDWSQALRMDVTDPSLQVTAGQAYRILLTPDVGATAPAIGWLIQFDNTALTYAGGDGFAQVGGVEYSYPDVDYGFRIYVETAVPEPATWALMLLGFGGLGCALRGRRSLAA